MDQNTFEASDLLSFDYAVDDELKDNEDEDVNCLDHENKNKVNRMNKSNNWSILINNFWSDIKYT
ncbi:hypothetical protein DERP_001220 [Dermatophagoides pteronyssinus]|uniref:Uncharacterized protein n=1 Tax=Dermatophagoides pteronyssinus TaxID=6956 RepID=A0ABQ8JDV3_DERPT|nr:hypothetical protein DERP_001220 [Dermatophagoides pteronyssinus]